MYSSTYIWAKVLGHMEQQLTPAVVSTWFDDTEVLELTDQKLVLFSPSTFRKDMIVSRCAVYIQEALNHFSRYRDDDFVACMKKIQSHLGKIQDTCQIKSLFDQFDAGKIDEKFALEKELFIGWRSCDMLEYFLTLPRVVADFRRAAKQRLRSLAAIRTSRRTKAGQNAGAHEPVK